MSEFFYARSSVTITAVLFVTMVAIIEIGYRLGRRARPRSHPALKDHASAIQNSLLGILALLLGFTFSLSLQRYEQRNEAVVTEANAIGTTWLRTDLLPDFARADAKRLVRQYLDLRVRAEGISETDTADRGPLVEQSGRTSLELWAVAARAAEKVPNPVTTGLFIQSLNDTIDAFGTLDAALNRHVPELVLFLLYITFLLTGSVLGITAGLSGHRASFSTYIMVGLVIILVFIIIDLDRPRRGLIRVSHKSMIDLQAAVARQ